MEYFDATQRIQFPDPEDANPYGLLATGGNLSPGIVLSAYEQGIFPWYDREPILWFSPDPRFVLYLRDFHISKRLRRTARNTPWTVTFDHDFPAVIEGCRTIRKAGEGTWITPEMVSAYTQLHRLGYTHSVEVWENDTLVGGLYGLGIGSFFAGESMFSRKRDASKLAFIALVGFLHSRSVSMIDCQSYTNYLASFGAIDIPREDFLATIGELQRRIPSGPKWQDASDEIVTGAEMVERGIELSTQNDRSAQRT